jgi:hypothetical protein
LYKHPLCCYASDVLAHGYRSSMYLLSNSFLVSYAQTNPAVVRGPWALGVCLGRRSHKGQTC